MKETKELLVVEKENGIFNKIKNLFFKITGKYSKTDRLNIECVNIQKLKDTQTNIYIQNAKKAFENYAVATEYQISEKICEYLKERIKLNKDNIQEIIKLAHANITFEEILNILQQEYEEIYKYKQTIKSIKIDEKYALSEYLAPLGVIAVETEEVTNIISNIFKAISTRNAIILLSNKCIPYGLENLILVIVQEALNKFGIDSNIIQILKPENIPNEDREKIDVLVTYDGQVVTKIKQDKLYIYKHDDYFNEVINEEVKKLKELGKNVEVLTGDIDACIDKINEGINEGVSIYTQDRKQGYMFINKVHSKNVFFNATLQNITDTTKSDLIYYMAKNIICEYMLEER
jgi:gamma-glutamyl phosphate reductase